MGSARLPGKALIPINGKPLLRRLSDRLRAVRRVSSIVVATSDQPADQQIEDACRSWGVPVMRGPETDVLTRFLQVADAWHFDNIVRVTGDNPLTDPEGIDELVGTLEEGDSDIVHNAYRGGYPYGTGAELFRVRVLRDCDQTVSDLEWRENVFAYARQRPQRFLCRQVAAPADLYRPGYFLTVDYAEDKVLLEHIYAHFDGEDTVSLRAVVGLLDDRPELAGLNAHLHQPFPE